MKDEKYISNLIGAFATTISSEIEKSIAELDGRSLSHEIALVAIYNHPNETISTLSKVLAITHSGAVRLINTLENEGLVERYKSEQDARSVVLHVSDKGKERAQSVLFSREKVTSNLLKNFNEAQRRDFLNLLEIAMSNLTDKQIEARRICRLCDEGICRKLGCPVEKSVY
jgi:MarR family transcriptional repressor of emrRAB